VQRIFAHSRVSETRRIHVRTNLRSTLSVHVVRLPTTGCFAPTPDIADQSGPFRKVPAVGIIHRLSAHRRSRVFRRGCARSLIVAARQRGVELTNTEFSEFTPYAGRDPKISRQSARPFKMAATACGSMHPRLNHSVAVPLE
jgi:hypothetical protein